MEGYGELPELDIALEAGLSPPCFANGGGGGGGGGGSGASGSLRCVDSSHGAGCERCVACRVRCRGVRCALRACASCVPLV